MAKAFEEKANKSATAKRPAGRPRSKATHQAVLDAAVALLESHEYKEVTIERIAAEAKVGKKTIYRWWPSKAEIMLEAYTERAFGRLPMALPSGDAFADLEDIIRTFFAVARNPVINKGLRSLVAEAQLDVDFRQKFYRSFIPKRRALLAGIIEQGIKLRQFRANLNVDLAVDLIYGAFWFRLLFGTHAPRDDDYAEDVIVMLRPSLEASAVAR